MHLLLILLSLATVDSFLCQTNINPWQGRTLTTSPTNCAQLQAALRAPVTAAWIRFNNLMAYDKTTCPPMAQGQFSIVSKGTPTCTATLPCLLDGWGTGELRGKETAHGYTLWVEQSAYWWIYNMKITGSQKNVIIDHSHDICLQWITADNSGSESVHFRFSTYNSALRKSTVKNAGVVNCGNGEGVYIGSDPGNWEARNNPDKTKNILIEGNIIGPGLTDECIDIKDITKGVVVRGNTFYGDGLVPTCNSATQLVDIKGPGNVIQANTFTFVDVTKANSGIKWALSSHIHSKKDDNGKTWFTSDCNSNSFCDNVFTVAGSASMAINHQCKLKSYNNRVTNGKPVDDNKNVDRTKCK